VVEWMAGQERLGREELGQGGTWVQEGAARQIWAEGSGANGFCVHGRKAETERI